MTKYKLENYQSSNEMQSATIISLIILGLICLFPELSFATSIESQMDKVGALTGKGKVIGVTGATVCTFIWAMFRGRPGLAGAAVAIGVIAGLYLEWIAGGMKVTG